MSIQQSITDKINQQFNVQHLEVVNESHMHSVPANSETHFKVTLVSPDFEGLRLLQRHRALNTLLADELAGEVHALALHTYTEIEWQKKQGIAPDSPNCLGGSKAG